MLGNHGFKRNVIQNKVVFCINDQIFKKHAKCCFVKFDDLELILSFFSVTFMMAFQIANENK